MFKISSLAAIISSACALAQSAPSPAICTIEYTFKEAGDTYMQTGLGTLVTPRQVITARHITNPGQVASQIVVKIGGEEIRAESVQAIRSASSDMSRTENDISSITLSRDAKTAPISIAAHAPGRGDTISVATIRNGKISMHERKITFAGGHAMASTMGFRSIQPGDSGGPWLNSGGQLLGVTALGLDQAANDQVIFGAGAWLNAMSPARYYAGYLASSPGAIPGALAVLALGAILVKRRRARNDLSMA